MSIDTKELEEQFKKELQEVAKDKKPEELVETLAQKMARLEKMRRDTQAAYTKGQQRLKALEKEREVLAAKIKVDAINDPELDELKYEDPDKWYQEIERRKREKREALDREIAEARKQAELEARKNLLLEFAKANPDLDLTNPDIQDSIPPKYLRELEAGEVTFEEFLNKVTTFLKLPKQVGEQIPEKTTDLSKTPGSSTPKEDTIQKQVSLVEQYHNLVF